MADIFFSYSSTDRERVRRVHDVLENIGFEIFWDQKNPVGTDWDSWIRKNLTQSKCAVVFWSAASAASDNVRHEATVAKQQGKLISAFIEPLTAEDMPMGLYAQQAANLTEWNGDRANEQWRKFCDAVEAKLMPRWVQEKIGLLDAELEGQRARREAADAHEKRLRAQIAKEAKTQEDLRRERDEALSNAAELKTSFQAQITKQAEAEEALKSERDNALAEVKKLNATVEGLAKARPDADGRSAQLRRRWPTSIVVGIALLVAALGGLISLLPRKNPDTQAETKIAELTSALTESEKARQDAEANVEQATATLGKSEKARQAAENKVTEAVAAQAKSEQARQAAEAKATDSEKARQTADAKAADSEKARQTLATKAADAEKARQTAEAKAADSEKARQAAEAKAADADKSRVAAEAKAAQAVAALAAAKDTRQAANANSATVASSLFTSQRNMAATAKDFNAYFSRASLSSSSDCERLCATFSTCMSYTYSKPNQLCYQYRFIIDSVEDVNFDSGSKSTNQSVTQVLFTWRNNMEAKGWGPFDAAHVSSVEACENNCARLNACKIYTYRYKTGWCYLYSSAELVANEDYGSGIRQ